MPHIKNFTPHKLQRQARKEAWYGDSGNSWNPWRKNVRSNTWSAPIPSDPEKGVGIKDSESEPVDTSQTLNIGEDVQSGTREIQNTTEREEVEAGITKSSSPTQGVPRLRYVKTNQDEDADVGPKDVVETPKKEPWYKGKTLKHKPFTLKNQLQATLFNSWINILLLAVPAGIICNYVGVDGTIVFIVNFIAIVPLAGLLSFATEEIALHVGESLGGLLNASFGNAVEIIVAVIALAKDEILVVQTSLIGSILSNLLLVMGMCFLFGGLRRSEQYFNETVAQTAASLLALSIGSIIIPTCFHLFTTNDDNKIQRNIASLSRGTSVILLVVYAAYLYFQLHTHQTIFAMESQKVEMKPRKNTIPRGSISKVFASAGGIGAGAGRPNITDRPPHDELFKTDALEAEKEEPEEPQLHIAVAWATLAGATVVVGLCAEFMVDGISSITKSGHISVEFVGLILLPIVGNAAEHATAVTVAIKDKMDLAIGVAVGSSMQISLLVIPLLVVIGWIMGKDAMTLSFDGFQVAVLFVSVLLVNYLIGDGKSHWLEGMLLMCLYIIIAICAWYYPVPEM